MQAVQQLCGLAKRSRTVVLGAIREGAAQGSIRNDISPEVLIVTVLGTIHALTGLSSTNRPSALRKTPDPERVIAGLGLMLATSVPKNLNVTGTVGQKQEKGDSHDDKQ